MPRLAREADAAAVRRAGPRRLNVPLMWGDAVLNYGRAKVVSKPEPVEIDPADPYVAALRSAALDEARTGVVWTRRSAEFATSTAVGGFAPGGALGYVYGGGTHDKSVTLSSVRLVQPTRFAAPSGVPAQAESVLAMKPGESISLTRDGATKLFGGNMKTWLDESAPDGTWFAGGPVGADLSVEHRGRATTEILRGAGNEVRVRVFSDDAKSAEATVGAHIGVYLSWAGTVAYEIARRLRGAEKTAAEMAKMPVWREHSSGAFVGVAGEKARDCLAEIRLDLSKPDARRAYAAVVRGDVDIASQLADKPDSGVTVPVSRATEITRRAIPVSLGLFGLGVSWTSSTDKYRTTVWDGTSPITREGTVETKERAATGWSLRRIVRSAWLDRATTSGNRTLPKGIDAKEVSAGWACETRDPLTSKDELLAEIDFVRSLLGDAAPESIDAYRAKVEALEPKRFVRFGPRNEGGSTTASMALRFARTAPEHLSKIDTYDVYRAWADIVAGGNDEGAPPEWADPKVRDRYDAESTDGVLSWKELSPEYLTGRQGYFDARNVVREIAGMGTGDAVERQHKLRDFIGVDADRRDRLTLLARLLDPKALSVELDIDSDRGPEGLQLDFHVAHIGGDVKAKNGLRAYLARAFGIA